VPDPAPFGEGVMSGDPMPGASTIWTRVTPPPGGGDVGVIWAVAEDESFTSILAGGVAAQTGRQPSPPQEEQQQLQDFKEAGSPESAKEQELVHLPTESHNLQPMQH
jgi:phosphodiesterase/alkaline phosphatase D-like protein